MIFMSGISLRRSWAKVQDRLFHVGNYDSWELTIEIGRCTTRHVHCLLKSMNIWVTYDHWNVEISFLVLCSLLNSENSSVSMDLMGLVVCVFIVKIRSCTLEFFPSLPRFNDDLSETWPFEIGGMDSCICSLVVYIFYVCLLQTLFRLLPGSLFLFRSNLYDFKLGHELKNGIKCVLQSLLIACKLPTPMNTGSTSKVVMLHKQSQIQGSDTFVLVLTNRVPTPQTWAIAKAITSNLSHIMHQNNLAFVSFTFFLELPFTASWGKLKGNYDYPTTKMWPSKG